MINLPLRLAAVCVAAGSLGACASRPPPMAELGMADEPVPVHVHRMWINPFFRHASYVQPVAKPLSSNSAIAEICAHPEGKAVLDRDLPGLTERPEYDFFKHMSLQTLRKMSRGQMSADDVAKVDADLAKLTLPAPAQTASLP